MKRRFWIAGVVVALLVTATVVWAAYTGPIRPRQVTQTTGWVRSIYRNNPWQLECRCGMSGPGERCADNDYACFCGDAPYNNGSLYTCYEDGVTTTVTHNPATASGGFSCGTMGNDDWCRANPRLNVSGNEPVSGYVIQRIEGNYDGSNTAAVSCSGSSCSFTPPQGAGTFWYWAVSSYGDTSAKYSMAYKVDTVAPSITPSLSGTAGNAGWYRSDVTLSATASDAVSGLYSLSNSASSGPGSLECLSLPCTITMDGTTQIDLVAQDRAGNTSTTSVTVRKDATPPDLHLNPQGVSGIYSEDWYRSNVTFQVIAEDATSGVADLTLSCGSNPCTISAQGETAVSVTATDAAGNSTHADTTIRVDTIPPSVSLNASGPSRAGWYIGDVTVTATSNDPAPGSGVYRVLTRANTWLWNNSPTLTITTDGVYNVEGQAEDTAGNYSQTAIQVRRDTIPPTVSLNLSPTGQNGWFITHPTLSVTASDATSGVYTRQIRVNGGAWQSSVTIGTDGIYTVEGRAQDNAGHWSDVVSGTVRVDTTPPQTSLAVNGQAGQNGWYTSPVTVAVQAEDATSGIDQVALDVNGAAANAAQTTLEDGVYQLSAYSVDAAGLVSETATLTVQVDATPPQAAFGDFPARLSRTVELTGSVSDGLSGVQTVELSLDGGNTWETLTAVNGEWRTTWDTTTAQGGDHTLVLRAVDAAGNTTMTSRTVRVANRAPSAWVTASWPVWESGKVDVNAGDLPVKSVCISIRDPQNRWPEVENCYDSLSDVPREVKWDRRFADGTRAPAGSYLVRVEITDILGQRDVAQGEIVVPLLAALLPLPSVTPTPTATPTLTPTKAAAAEVATATREAPAPTPTATPTRTPVKIAAIPAAVVSRPLWPFLTLLGLTLALGYSAMSDERPKAIRKLAERMAEITRMEVK